MHEFRHWNEFEKKSISVSFSLTSFAINTKTVFLLYQKSRRKGMMLKIIFLLLFYLCFVIVYQTVIWYYKIRELAEMVQRISLKRTSKKNKRNNFLNSLIFTTIVLNDEQYECDFLMPKSYKINRSVNFETLKLS